MNTEYIEKQSKHKWIILFVDVLLIVFAYLIAFNVRYTNIQPENWNSFMAVLPWILLIGVFFFSIYELYYLVRKSVWDIITGIFIAVTFMSFITMSFSFLIREFAMPRSVILIASVILVVLLLIWKITFKKLVLNPKLENVLLIGSDDESKNVISQMKGGIFSKVKIKHASPNTSLERIDELLKQVDYVFLCPSIPKEEKGEIIYHTIKAQKIVYVIPTLYELLMTKSEITNLDDTMVMSVKPFGLTWDQQFLKRAFDFVVSSVLLIVLSPLFLMIALAMKLEEPRGSIIYKQERLGKNNRPFMIYKFRSMIETAEAETGPTLATKNDDRITRIGKYLRLLRLDELPQLLNVLQGSMSIVGPRPERPFFIKKLNKQFDNYCYRSSVKPGITGFAQIMGKYSTDVQEKLRYDLYYIRNYTFWLDIIILFRTIIVLLDKTKAEGETVQDKQKTAKPVSTEEQSGINFNS